MSDLRSLKTERNRDKTKVESLSEKETGLLDVVVPISLNESKSPVPFSDRPTNEAHRISFFMGVPAPGPTIGRCRDQPARPGGHGGRQQVHDFPGLRLRRRRHQGSSGPARSRQQGQELRGIPAEATTESQLGTNQVTVTLTPCLVPTARGPAWLPCARRP